MPIGTRVKLASGGPTMLIVDRDKYGVKVCCAWVDADGFTQEYWFATICLNVVRKMYYI